MNVAYIASSPVRRVRDLDTSGRIVLLLVAFAVIRGILYALVSPPFSAPDEKGHYDYLASLYEHGLRMIEGREKGQPPLYYLLCLPVFSAFAGQTSDFQVYALAANNVSLASLLAVRCFSALLTATTVPLAYWTARELCPGDRFVTLGAAAFVALVPAYGWVGASINNDSLASVFSSVVVLLLVRGIARGFTLRSCLLVVAIAAAGVGTKSTALPVAAVVPLAVGARLTFQLWPRERAVRALLTVGALAALFFASPLRSLVLGPVGKIMRNPMTLDFMRADRVKVFTDGLDVWPFVYQFKTFWGSFSNDSVQLPSVAFFLLALVSGASVLGILVRMVGIRRSNEKAFEGPSGTWCVRSQLTVLIGLVALEWAISFARFYNNQALQLSTIVAGWNDNFTLLQGRFLYPAMVPIAFLFAWGLRALLPSRWADRSTWLVVAVLLVVDWVAIATLALGGHSWQIYSSES